MAAPKVACTWPAVAPKVRNVRLRDTGSTVNPCEASQAAICAVSLALAPNWPAYCSGVNHLWKLADAGFCWS